MMNIVITNALKNIKNSVLLNIIILVISVVILLTTHKIILTLNEHKNYKYAKEFEVYKEGEDKDVFYFNDYEDNDIKTNIENIYKNNGLKIVRKNIILPASLILRSLSEYVVVSAYDDYSMLTNHLIEGSIFTSTNNSVIISEYLPLKTNDVFQLFIRDSLAGYKARTFFVSGIYSITNINADENTDYIDTVNETVIYTSINTISNFLYTEGSGKNPYFEKYILYFDDYKKVDKIINSFDIKGFVIHPIVHSNFYTVETTKIYTVFALVSTIIASIFLISTLNYLQIQHRISLGYLREYKVLSKRSQFIQIFSIDAIAIVIYLLILKIFSQQINFISLITSISILLSAVFSVLFSVFRKYKCDEEELK